MTVGSLGRARLPCVVEVGGGPSPGHRRLPVGLAERPSWPVITILHGKKIDMMVLYSNCNLALNQFSTNS
uniref:Uncharacterized protein n=1 Tax=Arundo donax TaxID=35708 RepID=A0A0A8Y370_ARUDO